MLSFDFKLAVDHSDPAGGNDVTSRMIGLSTNALRPNLKCTEEDSHETTNFTERWKSRSAEIRGGDTFVHASLIKPGVR